MPSLSFRANSLQESAIRKLDQYQFARPEIRFYRLNIGQPDIQTPLPLLDAISSFQPKVIAYGPSDGLPGLRTAAAKYHSRWCPTLTAENVSVTVGGSEALLFAFTAICDPGDEILAPEPYYTNYNGFATVAGIKIKPLSTHLKNKFSLPNNQTLDSLVTPKTKAIVFSNPANPTGKIYQRAELERLTRWAQKHDLFIIADEVYRRIWFDKPPTSMLEIEQAKTRLIVVDSMSKTYSACGLRLGFFISRNPFLMEKIARLGQARLGAQPLAQHVAMAALKLPEEYYETIRKTYKTRTNILFNALSKIKGVSTHKPEGAFYLMTKLPVKDTEHFAHFLASSFQHKNETIMVAPGSGFYADPTRGRDEIRLAAVMEKEKIEHAIELLSIALQKYNSKYA